MRETTLFLLILMTVLFVAGIVWFEYKSTTYQSADGSCQSLTVDDDCY